MSLAKHHFDIKTFLRTGSVLAFCVFFLWSCESNSPEQTGVPGEGQEQSAAGEEAGFSPTHRADSLLKVIRYRLRNRKLAGLENLIKSATSLYQTMDTTLVNDSLRWSGYYTVQTFYAGYLREMGQYDQCLALLSQIYPGVRKKFGDSYPLIAAIYNVKSAYFLFRGALDSSKVYANRAIRILHRQPVLNNSSLQAAHTRLARAGFQGFDFQGAMTNINQAIEYARQSNNGDMDSLGLGVAYNLRAGIHYTLQEYEETVEYLEKAYRFTAEIDPFWEAIYTMNVAGVLVEVGNVEEALKLNRKAKKILQTIPTVPPEYASILKYNFGIIFMDLEVYDSAAVYLSQILEWRKQHTPQQELLIAANQNSLAYVYTKQNKLNAAKTLFEQSRRIYRSRLPAYHPEWSRYDLLLSTYYQAAGMMMNALEVTQHALNCVLLTPEFHPINHNPEVNDILLKGQALKAYAQKSRVQLALAKHSGDDIWLDQCLKTVSAAIQLIDRMRADYQLAHFRRLLNHHSRSIYTSGINAAVSRYRKYGNTADLELAFEFSSRSKAGKLRDIQRELNAKQHVAIPDSLRRLEDALQTRIWRAEVTLNLLQSRNTSDSDERVTALKDTLHLLLTRYGEFKRKMQQTLPAFRALMYTAPAFSTEKLRQHLLDEDTAIIDVFNSGDSVFFFVVLKDTIGLNSLELTREVKNVLSTVRQNLMATETDYRAFCKNAYQLYRGALNPIQQLIKHHRLIFIPDKAFYAIPIAALLTEPVSDSGLKSYADLPYLIRQHPIRYTYSATLLQPRSNSVGALPPEDSFIAYAPGFMDGLPSDTNIAELMMTSNRQNTFPTNGALPFSEPEVKEIRDLFLSRHSSLPVWLLRLFDRSSRLHLNRNATETNLFSEQLNQYRYVHFSTHGFFYEHPAPLAGLLLYPDELNDGIILPEDIYRLKLNADLVVLSACQTALGEWETGEGLMGPTQAFLQAGVNNLLVTLWQTENRSAREMMLGFYREMLSGKRKDSALQKAQLEMLETEDFQHPGYWAPYILIGK